MNFTLSDIRQLIRLETMRTGTPLFDEDLAQEASMRVLDAFRRVRHVEHPKAFLRKIVVDTVRDHWRRRRVSEDVDAIDERFISFRPQLEAEMDRRRQTALLRSAVGLLAPPKQKLVRLYYEDDLSIPEIARLQNSSVPAVKMQLLRIRQELKGALRVT